MWQDTGPRLPPTLLEDGGIRGGGERLEEPPWVGDVGEAAVSSWPTAPPRVVVAATGAPAATTPAVKSSNVC